MHVSHNATLSCVLAAAVSLASALAACGPAAPPASSPGGAAMPGGPAAPREPSSDGGVTPAPTSAPAPSAPRTMAKAPAGPMKLPVATTMAEDLQAIGLDPTKLPALSKLDGEKLRRVMKLFTKSLGVKCGDCHAEDFAASTPMKNIAERMWDDFTRGLALDSGAAGAAGAPIFCDSCHGGHAEFLDRHDMKALGKWMDDAYVGKLTRRDGQEHECATCHGDPFEGEILKEWAKGPRPSPKPAPHAPKAATPARR